MNIKYLVPFFLLLVCCAVQKGALTDTGGSSISLDIVAKKDKVFTELMKGIMDYGYTPQVADKETGILVTEWKHPREVGGVGGFLLSAIANPQSIRYRLSCTVRMDSSITKLIIIPSEEYLIEGNWLNQKVNKDDFTIKETNELALKIKNTAELK